MGHNFKMGQKAYFVMYNTSASNPGGYLNAANYQVYESVIESIQGEHIGVRFNGEIITLGPHDLFKFQAEASQERYKHSYHACLLKLVNELSIGAFPSKILKPNFAPTVTGNPLRFGERNILFVAQTNTWIAQENVQKVLQTIAIVTDDLKMLLEMTPIISMMNDYAKKLFGKFIVVELNSLFTLLAGSLDSKGLKDFNDEYKNNEFKDFISIIEKMEAKHHFREVRNSIAAHMNSTIDLKDYAEKWSKISLATLIEYWKAFIRHLNVILPKYYPDESGVYFQIRNKEIKGTGGAEASLDYTPFHEYKM